jgi:hypothetical protein
VVGSEGCGHARLEARLLSDGLGPFPKPEGGKLAVKVINDHGDYIIKVSANEADAHPY